MLTHWTPWRDLGIILRLAALSEGDIVEIGCNRGVTTKALAVSNPRRLVIGIDYSGPTTMLKQQMDQPAAGDIGEAARHLQNVAVLDINSRSLSYEHPALRNAGFIFIDGDHSYDGVEADTAKAIEHLDKGTGRRALVWHDYTSEGNPEGHPDWVAVGRYIRAHLSSRDIVHFVPSFVAALLIGPWPDNLFQDEE